MLHVTYVLFLTRHGLDDPSITQVFLPHAHSPKGPTLEGISLGDTVRYKETLADLMFMQFGLELDTGRMRAVLVKGNAYRVLTYHLTNGERFDPMQQISSWDGWVDIREVATHENWSAEVCWLVRNLVAHLELYPAAA